jgi:ATPase subunit of ABC transporter with duplicated ATPase domains
MTTSNLLHAHRLALDTPAGRPLFRDLTLILDRGDRVALVGRNGAGKSTLLSVLAGERDADGGDVMCHGRRVFVPQAIAHRASCSPGEARKRRLQDALDVGPDLLLLDEPTHDLDQAGLDWLVSGLRRWRGGLLVVSHDRRVLREFSDFFVIAESGCRHFGGSCDELLLTLRREQVESERRYVRELERLGAREQHQFLVSQRRERKKNVGRVRELGRGTPRILLNAKRGYAQEKQAKRNLIQRDRLDKARGWVAAARRSLAVELPLQAALPQLPPPQPRPIAQLRQVSACSDRGVLFEGLSLEISRQRVAVTGPNGSGKSTLLELLAGVRHPQSGTAHSETARIAYIAQNAANWCLERSLLHELIDGHLLDPEAAVTCIRAHAFPLALAERPLASLSPGERLRAAPICSLQRPSPPELLILDEPTGHLDFLGHAALQDVLTNWPGGLVVVSHDEECLSAIGVEARVTLAGARSRRAAADPGDVDAGHVSRQLPQIRVVAGDDEIAALPGRGDDDCVDRIGLTRLRK